MSRSLRRTSPTRWCCSAPPATSPARSCSRRSTRWSGDGHAARRAGDRRVVVGRGPTTSCATGPASRVDRALGRGADRRGRVRRRRPGASTTSRATTARRRPSTAWPSALGRPRRRAAALLPRHPAGDVRRRHRGPGRRRPHRRRPGRRREALRPRPRVRPASSTRSSTAPSPRSRCSASTTSSARSRSRTCSCSASPTRCSSRSGTATSSQSVQITMAEDFGVAGPGQVLRRGRRPARRRAEPPARDRRPARHGAAGRRRRRRAARREGQGVPPDRAVRPGRRRAGPVPRLRRRGGRARRLRHRDLRRHALRDRLVAVGGGAVAHPRRQVPARHRHRGHRRVQRRRPACCSPPRQRARPTPTTCASGSAPTTAWSCTSRPRRPATSMVTRPVNLEVATSRCSAHGPRPTSGCSRTPWRATTAASAGPTPSRSSGGSCDDVLERPAGRCASTTRARGARRRPTRLAADIGGWHEPLQEEPSATAAGGGAPAHRPPVRSAAVVLAGARRPGRPCGRARPGAGAGLEATRPTSATPGSAFRTSLAATRVDPADHRRRGRRPPRRPSTGRRRHRAGESRGRRLILGVGATVERPVVPRPGAGGLRRSGAGPKRTALRTVDAVDRPGLVGSGGLLGSRALQGERRPAGAWRTRRRSGRGSAVLAPPRRRHPLHTFPTSSSAR